MEKTYTEQSDLTSENQDQGDFLQNLADQLSLLERQIVKMAEDFMEFERNLLKPVEALSDNSGSPGCCKTSKIIAFPEKGKYTAVNSPQKPAKTVPKQFQAVPGEPLPAGIFDFRPLLQRNGLILLAWDMRGTEMGERYTAYWVTSVGIPRFYASKQYAKEEFPMARPDHKSYAAEDGIEFFGQEAPSYLVHIAPELLMSNPRHAELRSEQIKKLEVLHSDIDYAYEYLLTKEKKRALSFDRVKTVHSVQAGA